MNPKIMEIQGWMEPIELEWLYQTVSKVPAGGLIVEIGAWKGRSSAALYEAAGEDKTVISIDTWKGQDDLPDHIEARETDLLQTYLTNMKAFDFEPKKFDGTILPGKFYLVSDSIGSVQYFTDGSIDFLFIDGDHRLCGADIDAFLPKMKPDGLLTGHDYFCFYETIQQEIHKRFYIHQLIHSIWVRNVGLYKPEWY